MNKVFHLHSLIPQLTYRRGDSIGLTVVRLLGNQVTMGGHYTESEYRITGAQTLPDYKGILCRVCEITWPHDNQTNR